MAPASGVSSAEGAEFNPSSPSEASAPSRSRLLTRQRLSYIVTGADYQARKTEGLSDFMSAWIRMIQFAESTGYLRSLYERIRGPNGEIDNVMKIHSLRPHTMEGHWVLYKSVMHHADNTLTVHGANGATAAPTTMPTAAETMSRVRADTRNPPEDDDADRALMARIIAPRRGECAARPRRVRKDHGRLDGGPVRT